MKSKQLISAIFFCFLSLATTLEASKEADRIQALFVGSNLLDGDLKNTSYVQMKYPFYYNNVINDVAMELTLYYIDPSSGIESKIGSARPIDIWLNSSYDNLLDDGRNNGYQNGYLVFPDLIGGEYGVSDSQGNDTDITMKKVRWYFPSSLQGKNITLIARLHWVCDYINGKKNTGWVHYPHDFEAQKEITLSSWDSQPKVELKKTSCDQLKANISIRKTIETTTLERGRFIFEEGSIIGKSVDIESGKNTAITELEIAQNLYPDKVSWTYLYTPAVEIKDKEAIQNNSDILQMMTTVIQGSTPFNEQARILHLSARLDVCDGSISVTTKASTYFTEGSSLKIEVYELKPDALLPDPQDQPITEMEVQESLYPNKSNWTSVIKKVNTDKRYYLKSYIDYGDFKENCIPVGCIVEKPTINAILNVESLTLEGSGDRLNVKIAWTKLDCNNIIYTLKRRFFDSTVNQLVEDSVIADFSKNSFIDQSVLSCISYTYWVEARLPPSISSIILKSQENTIDIPQQLHLTNLIVDKGQSSSGVRLYFTAPAPSELHHISISRTILSSTHAPLPTDTIYRIYAKDITKEMTWMDQGAEPGVLYEYTVTALPLPQMSCKVTSLKSPGFKDASATINGNVVYRNSSSSSPLVDVEATLNGENNQFTYSKSLVLDGKQIGVIKMQSPAKDSISANREFTWQGWINPGNNEINEINVIFAYNAIAIYMDKNQKLYCSIGDNPFDVTKSINLNIDFQDTDQYHQVTFVREKDSIRLYLDGQEKAVSHVPPNYHANDTLNTTAYIGAIYSLDDQGSIKYPFKGKVDEFRIWGKALSPLLVKDTYNTILNGEEPGLYAYWKFDEGTTQFFDRSRQPYEGLRGSNGDVEGGYVNEGSQSVPTHLRYRTRTDPYGNYKLTGLPFESGGTSYLITPKKGNHTFMPINKNIYVDQYNAIANNVDFSDQSSFKVKVKVLYQGTNYPVQGASFKINGMLATSEGEGMVTNSEGVLVLSVPYGKHRIKIEKGRHTFEKDTVSVIVEEDITTPIVFYDNTLIKVAGRVVGGSREAEKQIGFGQSINNIGAKRITLSYDINARPGSSLLPEGITSKKEIHINRYIKEKRIKNEKLEVETDSTQTIVETTVNRGVSSIYITPDAKTGEFECYLIPEIFKVEDVEYYLGNGPKTNFGDLTDWNLQNVFDSLSISHTYMIMQDTIVIGEEKQTYYYNYIKDLIYRTLPIMEIEQVNSDTIGGIPFYGCSTLSIEDQKIMPMILKDSVSQLIDGVEEFVYSGHYASGFPVFQQDQEVIFSISGYELYTKQENYQEQKDKVPLKDVSVKISNSFSANPKDENWVISFDPNSSKVKYQFIVGSPSGNQDITFPEKSYSSVFTAQYFFNEYPEILYPVETPTNARHRDDKNGQIRGYHLGVINNDGNKFVTRGPDKLLAVLRDPPGVNSFTILQKGSVLSKSLTEHRIKHYNAEFTPQAGVFWGGFKWQKNAANDSDLTGLAGLQCTYEETRDSIRQSVETITTTEDISTSSSSDFIGSQGDVYVGLATNVKYSDANDINFFEGPPLEGYPFFENKGTKYALTSRSIPFLGMDYNTKFVYSQSHIVDYLLPDLQKIKEGLLVYVNMDSAKLRLWQPDDSYFPETSDIIYVTSLKPTDKGYGTNNSDPIWKGATSEGINGPSYYVKIKKNATTALTENAIYNYNTYIKQWKESIAYNEKNKVVSIDKQQSSNKKNISFDAGTTYTYTKEIVKDSTLERNWEYMVMALGSLSVEGNISHFALNTSVSGGGSPGVIDKYHNDWNTESGVTKTSTQSYSYTLQDEIKGNYYSVDIIDPIADDSVCFSPMFRTQAGQTKCPYQGEDQTLFYKEDNKPFVLNYATAQIEKPIIKVNGVHSATFSNIPSGERFFFTLDLQNDGQTDMMSTFGLRYVDNSNPNSAYVYVDDFLIEGQTFDIYAQKGISKLFSVQQSRTDVTDYKIGLVLHSLCQMNPGIPGLSSVADTVWLSFNFQPAAPLATMKTPRLVLNTQMQDAGLPLTIPLTLSNLDQNYKGFTGIVLEYKSEAAQEWNQSHYFVLEDAYLKGDSIPGITTIWQDVAWNNEKNSFTCEIDFEKLNLPDGVYYVRAKSFLKENINGRFQEIAQTVTDPIRIVKDTERPVVVGHQPLSGILLPDGEISLSFNEMIDKGLVSNENTFTLKGILNGSQQTHSSGLLLDGTSGYAQTEAATSLSWKDRTIEMWICPLENRQQTLFSHGSANEFIELIADAKGILQLRMKKEKEEKIFQCNSSVRLIKDLWSHIAIRFEESDQKITILCMTNHIDQTVLESQLESFSDQFYQGSGPLRLGKSFDQEAPLLKGRIRDVRIWNRYLSEAEIRNNRQIKLSDQTEGLINYWLMDEAFGNVAKDRIGWQNLKVYCDWFIAPAGKSILLSDKNYLALNNYHLELTQEKDFTVELWVKAGIQETDAALFGVGKPDDEDAIDQAGILLADKKLILYSEGNNYVLSNNASSLLDGTTWHHLALSVNRNGYIQFFIDGQLVKSLPSTNIGALTKGILTLGAFENPNNNQGTCHFNGWLDGFRIWNKSLNHIEVNKWMNQKTTVSEPSVLYYFPFEERTAGATQGETRLTLGSQAGELNKDYIYVPRKDTMVVKSSSGIQIDYGSSIAAPIKDETMIEDILFTIKKEDQKLYLDISDNSLEKIDGASLDLTLKTNQIRDMNGNMINDPYEFDILLDLKTLKFKDTKKTIVQRVGQSSTFEIEISNLAGKKDYWQLNNLPWWLTLSQESGSLDPYTSIKIIATIDPTLPIGLYGEKLSLRGNQRVNHSLPIAVKIEGIDPMWKIDPAAYDYSMGIIGNIYIDDLLSIDPEDKVAAFDNGVCVGVAHPDSNTGLVFLTIYGKTQMSSTPLVFKIYDASKGIIYAPITIKGLTSLFFESAKVLGSPSAARIFTPTEQQEQQIALHKGWNWISTGVKSAQYLSQDLTDQGLFTISSVKGQQGQYLQLDNDHIYTGRDFQISPPDMYKAQVTQASLFQIAGAKCDTSVVLPVGYKWFGFWKDSPMHIAEAMSTIKPVEGDVIISQEGFAMYDNLLGWIGTLVGFEPGKGYIYNNTGQGPITLRYPSVRFRSAQNFKAIDQASKATHWSYNPYQYLHSMNITAVVIDSEEIKEGNYEIGAFVGDQCRGAVRFLRNERLDKLIAYLTIYANEAQETITFQLYDHDEATEYHLQESMEFLSDKIIGSPNDPFIFHLSTVDITEVNNNAVKVYPIPMKDQLFIEYASLPTLVRIIDMQGCEIWRSQSEIPNKIDVSQFSAGAYTLLITTDQEVIRKRLIKQ